VEFSALPDYFLRLTTSDSDAYGSFVTRELTAAPGIPRIDSDLTMKQII
jgi:DNA-binding Lrp family transcriptional regulator